MGWTGVEMCYGKATRKEIKEYLDHEFRGWATEKCVTHLIKSSMVSSVWYGVIQYDFIEEKSVKREAMVVLTNTSVKHGIYELCYKEMNETMGPNEAKCPESLLKLLTPTNSGYAIDWRARCKLYNNNERIYRAKKTCVWNIKRDYNFTCGGVSGELKTGMKFLLMYHTYYKRYEIFSTPIGLEWLKDVGVPKSFLFDNGNLEVYK